MLDQQRVSLFRFSSAFRIIATYKYDLSERWNRQNQTISGDDY